MAQALSRGRGQSKGLGKGLVKSTKLGTRKSGGKQRHQESQLWNILLLLQQRNRMSFSHWAERKRIPMSKFYCTILPSERLLPRWHALEASALPTACLPGLSSSTVYLRPQFYCPHPHMVKHMSIILPRVAWLLTHLLPDSPHRSPTKDLQVCCLSLVVPTFYHGPHPC